MKLRRVKAGLAAVVFLSAALTGWPGPSLLPKGTNLTSLVVIKESELGNAAQCVLIATLQGIVARQSGSQIYIMGTGAGCLIWPQHLKEVYGIPYTNTSDSWSLVRQYKNQVSGYVLYDKGANSNSLNAATSLCGPLNAVAVDASIESRVRDHGITNRLLDVRGRDEAWVWANYHGVLSHAMLVEQREPIDTNLRDYAAMAGAYTFFDENSPFRSYIFSQMPADTPCLGSWDGSKGEDVAIRDCSSNGVYEVGADWTLSLSTLSSVRDSAVYQRTCRQPAATPETNVHYVTFVTTDGDSVLWDVGDLAGYFNHPARGSFNMGWSISPLLADIAPSVLRWYYDSASNGPNRDVFTVGTSGLGYFYPSMYPPVALNLHVRRLNQFMDRADLGIVTINDFNSFPQIGLWNKYLAQPSIEALFYVEYTRYNALGGAVLFSSNGKPVISARDLLWGGLEEATNVVANINSYPRDPTSPAGYTLVEVHVWSKNLGDVQNVVTNLAPHVRVVTPEVFARLIRNNVGRRLSYDFPTGLQGWTAVSEGTPFARACWTEAGGNPGGAVLLEGLGANYIRRQIVLPSNATRLSFDTRANGDAGLRVQLTDSMDATVTLLDWEKLAAANSWVERTASLTNYAGQTVFLRFQQKRGGQGDRTARYVDNITVLTQGQPLYLPDAPKLLSVTASNDVRLLWRDNANNEAGFKIERRIGTNGVWSEISTVSSNVTSFTGTSAGAHTNCFYRLRSWNAAGNSAYSNVR